MSRRPLTLGVAVAVVCGAALLAFFAARHFRADRSATRAAAAARETPAAAATGSLLDGATLSVDLPEGESRRYPLALDAGRFLLLRVEQHEVDAVLRLYAPGGELIAESDGVNGAQGPEWISLVSERAGEYVLEVRADERPGETLGSIAVSIAESGPADQRNRRRVAADRKAAVGRLHYLEGTVDSLALAEVEVGEAAAEFRRADDAAGEADARFVLGAIRNRQDRFEDSLEPLGRALELAHALGDARREADTLWLRGWGYTRLAEWPHALDDLTSALPLWQSLGDTAREVRTLARIIDTYLQVGDRQRALEYATTALRVARSLGDSRELCDGYQALASVRLWLGTPQLALAPLDEALAISRRRGWRDAETASLISQGVALRMLGRNQAARAPLERALAFRREKGNPYGEAEVLVHLAGTYRNQDPERRPLLERALARSRESGYGVGVGTSLTLLAQLDLEAGDLGRARARVEEAVEVREAMWRRAPTSDLQATFLADQFPTYEVYTDVLAALDRTGADSSAAALAFSVVDGVRARALRRELQRASVEVTGDVPRELLDRRRDLGRALLAEERVKPADPAAASRIEALEAELRTVEHDLVAASPGWAALMMPAAVTVEEVQRDLLDPDTVLVEYALGYEHGHAFVVGSSSLDLIELPRRATIEAAARRVTAAVTARNRSVRFETVEERAARVASADADLEAAARALSEMVLDPLRGRIDHRRLALVLDGALQYVPFGVLPEPSAPKGSARTVTVSLPLGEGAGARAQASLAAGHEIVQLPSASALREIRRQSKDRARPAATLAVLADPVLEAEDPRLGRGARWWPALVSLVDGGASARSAAGGAPVGGERDAPHWPALPFAREEADSILALVPAGDRLGALGFDASRATATNRELARYRIVHFATHIVVDDQTPSRAGIVLSAFDRHGRPQDGVLTLFDIYQLQLPADLVVLSGCRTALGKEIRGEGLVGLTRGFMFAGAPRVLVSLWDVEDRATAELMKRFYSSLLLEHASPAAALRRAQMGMARTAAWSEPYYWAGFVLQGDWK